MESAEERRRADRMVAKRATQEEARAVPALGALIARYANLSAVAWDRWLDEDPSVPGPHDERIRHLFRKDKRFVDEYVQLHGPIQHAKFGLSEAKAACSHVTVSNVSIPAKVVYLERRSRPPSSRRP